ncbi:TIGR03619 family F420-dependent LLM class oxidoreductase [Mycolicibacterium setense]
MINRETIRVGALIGTAGSEAARLTVGRDAQAAEAAGFDTIWTFDHVLMPKELDSPYPFTDSGDILWNLDDPWFDTLIWLTAIAVSTSTVEIGTNVMVAGLRHPIELAKQIATIDQLACGRFSFGVGAGWLVEEFEALGIPAASRGRRLDEILRLLGSAWTGELRPTCGEHFNLTRAVHMSPTPAHDIPLLIGGMSGAAIRRVARLRAGWIAEVRPSQDPVAAIREGVELIYARADQFGTPFKTPLRVVYNVNESLDVLNGRLDALIDAGVTDIAISVDFTDSNAPAEALKMIRTGTS